MLNRLDAEFVGMLSGVDAGMLAGFGDDRDIKVMERISYLAKWSSGNYVIRRLHGLGDYKACVSSSYLSFFLLIIAASNIDNPPQNCNLRGRVGRRRLRALRPLRFPLPEALSFAEK